MEVHFPPDTEDRLARSAAQHGLAPDDLAREIVTRYFDDEARFVEAVKQGNDELDRGEYLTHEQVGERLRRFLRP